MMAWDGETPARLADYCVAVGERKLCYHNGIYSNEWGFPDIAT